MKLGKTEVVLWGVVIMMGIFIGTYPQVSRCCQENQQRKLIEQYLKGEMPSEKQLQGMKMLGVLWIPAVKCQLPIFSGTEEKVLENGAGLLEGSSEISDEKAVHTVLCAHSGLPQMYAFDQIDALEKGDFIYVISHQNVLVYTVTKQSTVLPEEVHLLLQPSQFANEITLLTCTPYGINTHRLLVQAKLSRSFGGSAS